MVASSWLLCNRPEAGRSSYVGLLCCKHKQLNEMLIATLLSPLPADADEQRRIDATLQ